MTALLKMLRELFRMGVLSSRVRLEAQNANRDLEFLLGHFTKAYQSKVWRSGRFKS